MNIKYRKSEMKDQEFIKNLISANLGEVIKISFKGVFNYNHYVKNAIKDSLSYIIMIDWIPCGFLWYTLKGRTIHINTIVISSEYQGRGIGREVFKELEELGRENNINYLHLGVQGSNLRAMKFYEEIGFEKKGYLQQFDTIYMQKKIR